MYIKNINGLKTELAGTPHVISATVELILLTHVN